MLCGIPLSGNRKNGLVQYIIRSASGETVAYVDGTHFINDNIELSSAIEASGADLLPAFGRSCGLDRDALSGCDRKRKRVQGEYI